MRTLLLLVATAAIATVPSILQASAGGVLKQYIAKGPVHAMGVEGAETAQAAHAAGYNVLFLSGSWVSKVVHDKPDTGFYTAQDALVKSREILAATPHATLIVDVDGGFGKEPEGTGSAANTETAVRTAIALEKAGVAGIVIDDQTPTDRKAEVDPGKTVISRTNMAAMIKAIRKAVGADFVIIGRTAAEETREALARADMLKSAGSDLIIVEAINDSKSELKSFTERTDHPLAIIQLDKGDPSPWSIADHIDMRARVVLLANALRKRWPDRGASLLTFKASLHRCAGVRQ